MANFLDDLSVYNAKAALVISQVVANGDTGKANMMSSLKTTANDTTLSEAIRLNALTALINLGSLLDVPLPPYFPLTTTYADTQTYVGIHDDLTGLQGGAPGDYQHITTAERNLIANAATLGDITWTNLGGSYTDNVPFATQFDAKQNALSGTGFVKISGTTISYDNSTFLTTISGIASGSAAGGELSGTYPNPALSNAAVISKLLTGFTGVALPTPITSSDTILSAMQKLNNNISSLIVSPSGVASVRLTTNSGGVFTTTTTAQTGTATLDVSLNSQSASTFLASPTSAAGVPTFRAFAATDLPNSGATAGTYGSSSFIPQIIVDAKGRITSISSVAAAAGGQVNTVTLTQPGIFTAATNIGTASAVNLNYGLSQQIANYVWAGPVSGANATPTFRSLVAADIPNIAISQVTSLSSTLDGFLTDSLSDGSIWIGNTSNAAVQRVLSGDVTVSNTGVTAIGLAKVQYDMIQDVTTQTLLGRYNAVDGEVQQITLLGTDFVLNSGTGVLSLASPVAPVVSTKGDLLGHDLTVQQRVPSNNIDGSILLVNNSSTGVYTDLGLNWVAMSGDATIAASGAITIGAGAVTLAKMATLANNRIIGNVSGGPLAPSALTGTQVTGMLDLFSTSVQGVVPAATNTAYFLRGDGSWQPITGTGTVTAVSITTANGFAGTSSGGATPALTIELNSLNGVLKGTGTAIAAATAGTDYISPGQITQTSGAGSGLTMASGSILGRTTASAGAIEAISVNSSLTLASTTLGLNLGNGNIFTVQQQMPSLRLNGATSGFVSFTPPAIAGAQVYELPSAVPSAGTTRFLTSTDGGVLSWQIPAGSGTTTDAVTFNSSGSGDASGTTFNGSVARTISYNTLGAQQASTNLTGLSGLTYTSGSPLIRMTAAGTFTLDAATYVTGTATQYALLVGGASNTVASLPAGATTGQLLQYNSGSNNPSWSTVVYPASTTQDRILFSSSNNVIGQIAAPSNNTFLQYASGSYAWTAAVTSLTLSTGITGIVSNSGTATAPILSVSGTLGGLVYFDSATSWDSTGALDQGELIVAGGTSAPVTINNGASGTLLKSNGGANNPSFTSATYPSTTQAYRILFSSSNDVVDQIAAPTTASTFLQWNGSSFTWAAAGGGGGSGTVGGGTIGQLAVYTAGTTVNGFPSTNSIIYGDASGAVANLGFSSAVQNLYLRVNSTGTGLVWDTAGGSGSGTVNNGQQFGVAYYPNTGTAVDDITPPSTNGGWFLYSNVTANAAVAPEWLASTGSGNVVRATSPTLTTPSIGAATATSVNGLTITNTTAGTLTIANGSTLATLGAFSTTLTATGGTNVTLPTTGTLATLAGIETLSNKTLLGPQIGDGGTNGHIHFRKSPGAVGINNYATLFFQEGGGIRRMSVIWDNDGYQSEFKFDATTATKTYTFPNATGTVALIDATQTLTIPASGLTPGDIALGVPGGSSTVSLVAPATLTGLGVYTLPNAYPLAATNYFLTSDLSGQLAWQQILGGGDVSSNITSSTAGNFAVFANTGGKTITEPTAARLSGGTITLGISGTQGFLVINDGTTAYTTTLRTATNATASASYIFPTAIGSNTNVLAIQNAATGQLVWSATGTGDITKAGTNQVVTGDIRFQSTGAANVGLVLRNNAGTYATTFNMSSTGTLGTTYITTFPAATGTVGLLEASQSWSAAQTFQAGISLTTAGTFTTTAAVASTFSGAATFSGAVTMERVGSASNPQLSINAGAGGTHNWINFATTGATAPTTGTRSSGTRFVFSPAVAANSLDYAIGVGASDVWLSAGTTTNSISFYAALGSGGTVVKLGGFTGNGLTLDAAGLAATPQLNFNGSGRNWINFATAGVASPANGATSASRSSGTRIVFSPTLGASSFDYAIGQGTAEMWFSVDGLANTFGFYAGTSRIAFFGGGAGVGLTLAGTLVGAASQDVFNTTSTTVNFAGAASTLTIGATTGTATIRNPTLALPNATQITVQTNKVVGVRRTGWTAQTATASRADLGANPSTAALASFCRALYDDLASLVGHGLIN